MPTISGMRRRGYPAEALRRFCHQIGITKYQSTHDVGLLEQEVRKVLNEECLRFNAVLDPIKVIVTNYPEDQVEEMEILKSQQDPDLGTRSVSFCRELFIERDDFMEDAPKKFFRLKPGGEVRFMGAYWLKCEEVVKDESGEITELHCTYDPETRAGAEAPSDGRKVKGTIHWVSARHAIDAEVRVYDRLFKEENPDCAEGSFLDHINPDSIVIKNAKLEPALAELEVGETVQFNRLGYFCVDIDSTEKNKVFNRTVGLRDSWAKIAKKS